jgi:chemotaxis response regulator CheB
MVRDAARAGRVGGSSRHRRRAREHRVHRVLPTRRDVLSLARRRVPDVGRGVARAGRNDRVDVVGDDTEGYRYASPWYSSIVKGAGKRKGSAVKRAKPKQPVRKKLVTAEVAEPVEPATFAGPAGQMPIIGIGASAGGLEALESMLEAMPDHVAAALIVVQHLDPNHASLLAELLQHKTTMTVIEAADGMHVEPDHVYVSPPGHDLSLLHGSLQLIPQSAKRGAVLPIDFFLRSLAQDQGDRSIGVILSGMGTDVTLGLRAIKEAAGATFVQQPESARFNSMPRSAIEAGVADIVAPASELPARILTYCERASLPTAHAAPPASDSVIEKICVLLREHSGNDFSVYKRSTVYRRIERRMSLHQIESLTEYLRFLRENPHELELLFKELLIGVTSFFRDPAEWDRLRADVLPALIESGCARDGERRWACTRTSPSSCGCEALAARFAGFRCAHRQSVTQRTSSSGGTERAPISIR